MSDIWHTPPQTPDVFKSHPIIVVYEAGDQIEQMNSKEYSDLVGERYVNRQCYVDELIKENDRTRKALDVAVDELTKIKVAAESVGIGFFMTAAIFALAKINTALEQITALEQKEG